MQFRRPFVFLIFLFVLQFSSGQSRKVVNVPDISGFTTLKCDFHMHTVFSDGTVWPTVRVKEAWEEGLDAISITDHIEYLPHSKDINADHNRSFEIAQPLADELNVLLVKATEITRDMPPGHLNALFITNANLLERDDVMDALREAREQGAFIFWNHPGWKSQQPDTTLWWETHTQLYENDLMHGIEVFNSSSYYPEALDWANEKKLTMFGNTDVHGPMEVKDGHRAMTLVFAKSRTLDGIKEALFSRRTVVYFGNTMVGESKYLEPLFFESLDFDKTSLRLTNKASKSVYIKNNSDVDYELELLQPGVGFEATETVTLKAHHVTSLELSGNSDEVNDMKTLDVYYQVKNMKISSKDNLVITFSFKNN
jgi:predicted metal-dependent phosphoesterase TrpH